MNKIRKGDEVIVLAGRDRGRRGIVSARTGDQFIAVEGVNLVKRHVKPNPMKGQAGGVIEKALPIHQSNVALYNPSLGRTDRVGVKIRPDGSRVRVFRASGEELKK